MIEFLQLRWLGNQSDPAWGGHLERGEPLSDQTMQRWLDEGLIEAVGRTVDVDGSTGYAGRFVLQGYVLTQKGREYVKG